jgi:RNA polymerase sigma-70 factor (ECF subfamily)
MRNFDGERAGAMCESGISTTVRLQRCLQRLADHDAQARGELLDHAARRLALLAEQMLSQFRALHRREESQDLFQQAMLRLWQSVERVGPTTVPEFMGLAAQEMRWALCDLARNHFGRKDREARADKRRPVVSSSNGHVNQREPADTTWAPDNLACWSEFHAAAGRLSDPERTAFDLLYYHELPQAEVATIMQVSERQVRRYWQSAREELYRMLEGWLP